VGRAKVDESCVGALVLEESEGEVDAEVRTLTAVGPVAGADVAAVGEGDLSGN